MGNEALSAQDDDGPTVVDYRAMQAIPEFQRLRRSTGGSSSPCSPRASSGTSPTCCSPATRTTSCRRRCSAASTWPCVLGLAQVVTTFAVTTWYVRFANRRLDPLSTEIREEIEADAATASATEGVNR